ncbi:hypothetical protein PS645_04024 [Pseudomonas fluorescens]|uniref:TetR family transcriptional regulator n=1 Tax=Pseudomonas fluorescens TaxID=294 RepID=A0A5E6VDB0_PSEFL|nr:hypothetical protein PS645_04024 [Pseudomonas fluorescens]
MQFSLVKMEHCCGEELGLRGQQSPTSDAVLNTRLEQVEGTLKGDDISERALVIMSTLIGALTLSRSVKNPVLAQKILDVARDFLKKQQS